MIPTLADILRGYAKDLDAAGSQYATMARHIRRGADCAEACEWIANQPIHGPAASMEDMQAHAGAATSWWAFRDLAKRVTDRETADG